LRLLGRCGGTDPGLRVRLAGGLIGAWFGGVTLHITGMLLGVGASLALTAAGALAGFLLGYKVMGRIYRRLEEAEAGLERGILVYYGVREGDARLFDADFMVVDDSEDDLVYSEDSEEAMINVWGLASSLAGAMSRRRLDIALVVLDEGVPIAVYPETATVEIDDDDAQVRAVSGESGKITVNLDVRSFKALAASVREGEQVVIKDRGSLEALYSLAKALSEAIHGSDNPMKVYIAYKAIKALEEKGVIRIEPELKARLPLEDEETRRRIREQVEEEMGLEKARGEGA